MQTVEGRTLTDRYTSRHPTIFRTCSRVSYSGFKFLDVMFIPGRKAVDLCIHKANTKHDSIARYQMTQSVGGKRYRNR
jgi:hypothetical protein